MATMIAVIGEFDPSYAPHAATNAAIEHSRPRLNGTIGASWVSTQAIDDTLFERFSGIWVAPGSPYKSLDKIIWAIRKARERGVPCLGTCGGFQHIVLEYARNVLGVKDAGHAEYDPYASKLFISQLSCSLAGREMRLRFTEGSRVASIYGALGATEQYYCNFGINPDLIHILKSGPMRFTGSDVDGEVRVLELPGHPFFIGTLFVPQARSTLRTPHPLVTAFLQAVLDDVTSVRHVWAWIR
jgi:CTP synthase (UTP-ammonia lyase)